jgi:hypothetical protein
MWGGAVPALLQPGRELCVCPVLLRTCSSLDVLNRVSERAGERCCCWLLRVRVDAAQWQHAALYVVPCLHRMPVRLNNAQLPLSLGALSAARHSRAAGAAWWVCRHTHGRAVCAWRHVLR